MNETVIERVVEDDFPTAEAGIDAKKQEKIASACAAWWARPSATSI